MPEPNSDSAFDFDFEISNITGSDLSREEVIYILYIFYMIKVSKLLMIFSKGYVAHV